MALGAKHIATFLLGAAAGLAAHKYMSMSEEEKQKLANTIKEKAHAFKDEAETSVEKMKDYFAELSKKGGEQLKEHLGNAENILKDLFNKKDTTTAS